MLQHFGCPTPTVDAFVSAANDQIPQYWTEMNSAWQRSRSSGFIWASPPFVWLKNVIKKLNSDKAHWILLLQDYSSTCSSKEAAYRGALDSITLANQTFQPHTQLFLRENGNSMGPTPWNGGNRAVWVDVSLDALPSEENIARTSAVGFQYKEDTDLRMPILSPNFENQSYDDAFSTTLAQHLDTHFVSAQPSPATANDASIHTRDVMFGRFLDLLSNGQVIGQTVKTPIIIIIIIICPIVIIHDGNLEID